MTVSPCTYTGSTSGRLSCTRVGATSLFVCCTQKSATSAARTCTPPGATYLAPPRVQQWTTLTGQPIPVMHYVQDGRSTYRNSSTTTVDLPDQRRNHQTARGEVA